MRALPASLVLASLAAAGTAHAQTFEAAPDSVAASEDSLRYWITACIDGPHDRPVCPPLRYRTDGAMLRRVYRTPSPVLRGTFRAIDATSYATFAAVPVVQGAAALARGMSLRPALATLAAEGAAGIAVTGLKAVLARERPYVAEPDIAPRIRGGRVHAVGDHSYSLPSGHAALAFATATSVALADRRTAVPAYAWATTVSAARLWHGVHYPSDVIAGAALGFVAGAAAHVVFGR